jgi:phosphatidylinositol 4-kinase
LAERNFVQALTAIGGRLTAYSSRALRMHQLYAELALLNLNLPARVFLPLVSHNMVAEPASTHVPLSPRKPHDTLGLSLCFPLSTSKTKH